jgi:hypothetical protein
LHLHGTNNMIGVFFWTPDKKILTKIEIFLLIGTSIIGILGFWYCNYSQSGNGDCTDLFRITEIHDSVCIGRRFFDLM